MSIINHTLSKYILFAHILMYYLYILYTLSWIMIILFWKIIYSWLWEPLTGIWKLTTRRDAWVNSPMLYPWEHRGSLVMKTRDNKAHYVSQWTARILWDQWCSIEISKTFYGKVDLSCLVSCSHLGHMSKGFPKEIHPTNTSMRQFQTHSLEISSAML